MADELGTNTPASSSAFRFLVTGSVLLGLLFYYAWDYVDGLSFYRTVQMWPITQGTVIKNSFTAVGPAQPKDPLKTSFQLSSDMEGVVYTYKVDRHEYMANCLVLAQPKNVSWKMFYDQIDPQSIASQYPVGTTVEVHYNFTDPKQACLDVTSGWKSRYIATCFTALTIIVPTLGFLVASLVIYLAENRNLTRNPEI